VPPRSDRSVATRRMTRTAPATRRVTRTAPATPGFTCNDNTSSANRFNGTKLTDATPPRPRPRAPIKASTEIYRPGTHRGIVAGAAYHRIANRPARARWISWNIFYTFPRGFGNISPASNVATRDIAVRLGSAGPPMTSRSNATPPGQMHKLPQEGRPRNKRRHHDIPARPRPRCTTSPAVHNGQARQ
jgi:hypothetical protein